MEKLLKCLSYFLFVFIIGIGLVHGGSENLNVNRRHPGGVRKYGPDVTPTSGEVWPKPQLQKNYGNGFMIVRPVVFRFEPVRHTCDILEDALKRYFTIMVESSHQVKVELGIIRSHSDGPSDIGNKTWKTNKNFHGYLDVLKIDLLTPCESIPHDQMEEQYEIKVDTPDLPREGYLTSATIWGLLRGLETFVQLVHHTNDFTGLQIRNTLILDYPRFPFRSVLLDSSRHYLSKKVLYENLDLMAMNKYNVFHWHIVDDQSFTYQSKSFPQISDKGAYRPYTHVYTQQDVRDIIEYARFRGIRVVPEFDTPGHTQSWGPGIPGLLTQCCDESGEPDGTYGPIDVSNPSNYIFLKQFFEEIVDMFPEKYLHLGGDEVEHQCWASNPNITELMERMNFTSLTELEGLHIQTLINIIKTFPQKNSYIVWQEVFDNAQVALPKDSIVHVWKMEHLEDELHNVTKAGYRALLYSCWYLNYISYGVDWHKYYACDPHNFTGTPEQKRLVFGGGAAMWGEYVDSTNLTPRLWPRAAVPAERLWSNAKVNDTVEAEKRLEEHRCRLLTRGYKVQPPNGPGYCFVSWDRN